LKNYQQNGEDQLCSSRSITVSLTCPTHLISAGIKYKKITVASVKKKKEDQQRMQDWFSKNITFIDMS
jgi:hypothetical protein